MIRLSPLLLLLACRPSVDRDDSGAPTTDDPCLADAEPLAMDATSVLGSPPTDLLAPFADGWSITAVVTTNTLLGLATVEWLLSPDAPAASATTTTWTQNPDTATACSEAGQTTVVVTVPAGVDSADGNIVTEGTLTLDFGPTAPANPRVAYSADAAVSADLLYAMEDWVDQNHPEVYGSQAGVGALNLTGTIGPEGAGRSFLNLYTDDETGRLVKVDQVLWTQWPP
jgi:hypothetical protein